MTVTRIFRGVLQLSLALLLIAGTAQAEPCLMPEERVWVLSKALDTVSAYEDEADRTSAAVHPSQEGGDNDPGLADLLHATDEPFIVDWARLIRTRQAARPTAPPSHRHCASPPTGPPLV